jgi:predicted site-specific integrase-resolvase
MGSRLSRNAKGAVFLDPRWIRNRREIKGHKMKRIGYARVSSLDQNLDRQIAALRAEGCDRIYREKASGKDMRNRPELAKAIDALPTKACSCLPNGTGQRAA